MTRKHYVKVAEILDEFVPDDALRAALASEFADMFEEDNPNFDRARFMAAAAVDTEV